MHSYNLQDSAQMQFEDCDSVPQCTVPPVSDGRDSTEYGLSNFTF